MTRRHGGRGAPWWQLAVVASAVLAIFAIGHQRTASARSGFGARTSHLDSYRDGTYSAWARGYHGRILATVVIRRGRIASVVITTCRMRYPCSMISALPGQVVARQNPTVDIVSGATDSAEVFAAAVDAALADAARRAR
jgi:uncharacterized protein with FMN-binding domain